LIFPTIYLVLLGPAVLTFTGSATKGIF
jgi:hypothetical protein